MKNRLLLIAGLIVALLGTNAWWFIRECEADRLKDSEIAAWQHAAKPVFDARGITYKEPTPNNLRTALDATYPLLPHEGYKGRKKWKKEHESRIYIEAVRTQDATLEIRQAIPLPEMAGDKAQTSNP